MRHLSEDRPRNSSGGRERRPRMTRRDFLATLGGGITVLLVEDDIFAQESGRGGNRQVSQEVGAWLHIGEDGAVTAYTGKVEVGQNARTSLTAAVDRKSTRLNSSHLGIS